ncbi:MAG: hypothetical protein WAM24_04115 [Ignavibacteriaceae bacterium]
MDTFSLLTAGLSLSFISGFMFARHLYLSNFDKRISADKEVISSLKQKHLSIFQRNNFLEQKLKQLQPNLFRWNHFSKK